jgi:eukaryotic-like serine/threonine-protein kinase
MAYGGNEDPTRVDGPRSSAPSASQTIRDPSPSSREPADTNISSTLQAGPNSRAEQRQAAESQGYDGSFGSLDRNASVAGLQRTLQLQDVARARSFLVLAAGIAVSLAAVALVTQGDHTSVDIFTFSMALTLSACLALWWHLRNATTYNVRHLLVVCYICMGGTFCGIYYFGVFSPAVAVVPFGLYFFGMAGSFAGTLLVYLIASLIYFGLAFGVWSGVLMERGLVSPLSMDGGVFAATLICVELVFGATYAIARLSRRATSDALEQHDRAVRAVASREALLAEARMDLDAVLKARGLGRFTGETVANYQLGRLLGRGGMGEVYEAVQMDSEKPAAIKLLHASFLSDPGIERRFWRECRVASSLDVPNVVKVLETSSPGDPIPFIAMERLHGTDLSDYLRSHERMRPRELLRMLRDIGKGLDAASAAGIVHRDIKPRNIFLDEADGQSVWKILDFGVSKTNTDATLTHQNVVGTPSYMAPEQAASAPLSHRTDLFSLGAILYRALTGRPAFTGDSPMAILYQVVENMPQRPSDVASRLHEDVDLVLAIALAKAPHSRFDSGEELASALEKALRGNLPEKLRLKARLLIKQHPWAEPFGAS